MLVKICGVARLADAEALDGLVEYIGFIVEPTSPRAVRPEALGATMNPMYSKIGRAHV